MSAQIVFLHNGMDNRQFKMHGVGGAGGPFGGQEKCQQRFGGKN